eukprot:1195903-Prorocentrum_minimum.AAC.1
MHRYNIKDVVVVVSPLSLEGCFVPSCHYDDAYRGGGGRGSNKQIGKKHLVTCYPKGGGSRRRTQALKRSSRQSGCKCPIFIMSVEAIILDFGPAHDGECIEAMLGAEISAADVY